ncbi:MAG: Ig-like domain-containing protein, partial [Clostridia bacterium]|nr:Ig-like domain-containing protein [Clostridia bacterium]
FTLVWTVDPEDVEVTFTVSNGSIASVDKNGVITALAEGNTVITVYAGGKTAVFVLNVLPKPEPPLPQNLLPKEGISVSEGYILGVKEMTTPEEILNMFENEAQYISITSSNETYAGTGTTVSLKDRDGNIIQTATVIVLGDCDGSGTITATDYLMIRRIVMMTMEYTDVQFEAARVSGMPSVTATDYLMVRRHFLGIFNIYTQTATE